MQEQQGSGHKGLKMADMDAVKNKVRKLLALGESPNPAEAASAMEKANKILLQYNLEMEDVTLNQNPEGIVEETFMTGFAARDHETAMVAAIARYNLCEVIINSRRVYSPTGNNKTEFQLVFIGKRHNIVSARIMCEYAFEALDKSAKKEVKGEGRKAVFSYKVGYCQELTSRLYAMINSRKETVTSECRDLVIVEDADNKKFLKEKYPQSKPQNMNTPDIKDTFAFFAGQLAAQRLGLNQQLGGE